MMYIFIICLISNRSVSTSKFSTKFIEYVFIFGSVFILISCDNGRHVEFGREMSSRSSGRIGAGNRAGHERETDGN